MSLINEMLRNLEKRAQSDVRDNAFIGLHSIISLELKRKTKYYFIITGLFGLLFFFVFVGTLTANRKSTLFHAGKVYQAPHLPSLLVLPPSAPQKIAEQEWKASVLTGIALQMHNDITYLHFLLDKNVLYHINSNASKNEFVIIFEHTSLLAPLPTIDYTLSGIQKIVALSEDNGNLKVILRLNSQAELKRLELNLNSPTQSPSLQLEIFYAVNSVNEEKIPIHNAVPLTIKKPIVENKLVKQYQESINLIELKAKMLVAAGKITEAVTLLERQAPPLDANPEYHAFIAALYQRQGQSNLAASLYKQLLNVKPRNSMWWLGLGVALEAMNDHGQAMEAYSEAENIGGLNPELKAYIETRLRST
jgi:tetratricopeptide (TPR) repeat protein